MQITNAQCRKNWAVCRANKMHCSNLGRRMHCIRLLKTNRTTGGTDMKEKCKCSSARKNWCRLLEPFFLPNPATLCSSPAKPADIGTVRSWTAARNAKEERLIRLVPDKPDNLHMKSDKSLGLHGTVLSHAIVRMKQETCRQ